MGDKLIEVAEALVGKEVHVTVTGYGFSVANDWMHLDGYRNAKDEVVLCFDGMFLGLSEDKVVQVLWDKEERECTLFFGLNAKILLNY